jgi:GNAT superfamily N-acetyltransferase
MNSPRSLRTHPLPEGVSIRPATPDDAPTILSLVRGLAAYEKLDPPDADAEARLIHDMFSTPPRIQAYLGECDGIPAGYAFVFETYSSFLALPTLYLEDLFVLPEFRGRKLGYALFSTMVEEAYSRGCGRMEWSVLKWNRLAIDFYERLGAKELKDWSVYRLVRDDMEKIIGQ